MFINSLRVESISNKGKIWKLIDPLQYDDKDIGTIVVPAEFETDFASVPRIPVIFELVGDRGHAAATIHDWLYSTGECTRKEADKVFLRALKETGMSSFRSHLMYYGVRLFGRSHFKK